MTFDKLKTIMERSFGTSKLSDIAKELSVSPQVVTIGNQEIKFLTNTSGS